MVTAVTPPAELVASITLTPAPPPDGATASVASPSVNVKVVGSPPDRTVVPVLLTDKPAELVPCRLREPSACVAREEPPVTPRVLLVVPVIAFVSPVIVLVEDPTLPIVLVEQLRFQ